MKSNPVRHNRPGRHVVAIVAACLLASSFAAAAKATSKGKWTDGAPRAQAFRKVLVVGVTPDVNQRCKFERFMASRLGTEATTVLTSCGVTDTKQPLTKDSIVAAVAAHQVDAVLATNLVSQQWGQEEGGSRDTRGNVGYKATDAGYIDGYYGMYGMPVIYGDFQANAAAIVMQGEVQVTSRLFETTAAKLLYSVDTKAKGIESSDTGLSVIAEAIADRLRKDGLTR
jgi:hypothetical protein